MNMETALKLKIELKEAWMYIANPKLSIDEAVDVLKELGNKIIKIDKKNRRILVAEGK